MDTPSRPAPFQAKLGASLTRVGRALAGGDLQTIAKAVVFSTDGLRQQLLENFTVTLNTEITELCRKTVNPPSLFCHIPLEKLSDFKWCDCVAELKTKAHFLLQVVSSLVSCNDTRHPFHPVRSIMQSYDASASKFTGPTWCDLSVWFSCTCLISHICVLSALFFGT